MPLRTCVPSLCVALALLVGCASSAQVARQPRSRTPTPGTPDSGSPPDAPDDHDRDGIVTAQGCEPRSLIPSGVDSACGRRVVDALFAQLVEYSPPEWRPEWGPGAPDAVARRITSPDARRWTIRLKEGWTFHDGEPVTAGSFVAAWNHAAYGPNAQPTAALFSPIEGFEGLRCRSAPCERGDVRQQTLEGLRIIDEHTLEVTLEQPRRSFPRRLGHVAFSPLPEGVLQDLRAYGEAPVGNGPYRMDGTWEHDRSIRLRRVDGYPGRTVANGGVEFRLLETREAAWEAMARGELDIVDELPPARIQEARHGAPDRFLQQTGGHYSFLVLPAHVQALGDDRLARALSMAIDRRRIIQEQLGGAATPAGSLVSPAVRGGTGDPCGAACRHNPAVARRLLAAAGGLPEEGLRVLYPRGAEYEPSLRAVAEQWIRTLRLPQDRVRLEPLSFPAFLAHVEAHRSPGPYRLGWPPDIPSPRNYLQPLHARGGLLNLDGYRNPTVERLLRRADRAGSLDASQELHRRAEQVALDDWHHIPLWFDRHHALHSERVTDVALGPFGHVRLGDVRVLAEDERSPGRT